MYLIVHGRPSLIFKINRKIKRVLRYQGVSIAFWSGHRFDI